MNILGSRLAALGALLLTAALVTGCRDDSTAASRPTASPPTASEPTQEPPVSATLPTETDAPPDADDPALDPALSEPVEDSVYPDVGDPSVDSLHYDLDLAWTPRHAHAGRRRDHRAPLDRAPATTSSSTSASRSTSRR